MKNLEMNQMEMINGGEMCSPVPVLLAAAGATAAVLTGGLFAIVLAAGSMYYAIEGVAAGDCY